jgi:anti-sigma regulatory factor (Ser/Thr protein kinase)
MACFNSRGQTVSVAIVQNLAVADQGSKKPRKVRDEPGERMTSTAEVALRLWPVPASCRDARQAVRRFCSDQSMGDATDDAVMLTSELMANAVEHSKGMVTLLALMVDEALVVAVRDDSDDLPTLTDPPSYAERGRGLQVIDALAGDWGVDRQASGKTVWFRLPR